MLGEEFPRTLVSVVSESWHRDRVVVDCTALVIEVIEGLLEESYLADSTG